MKRANVTALLLAGLCCWQVQPAAAQEGERFKGGIGVGVMAINRSDNLDPDGSDASIDSLDQAADSELTIIPLVAPFMTYDVGSTGGLIMKFFIKPPIEEAGGMVINLGGAYVLPAGGSIELNALAAPLEEVWENPYLVGERRSTTDNPKYGLHLAWKEINGSGLSVHGVYLSDEVDTDRIGRLRPEMARDGTMYALAVEYGIPLSKTVEIKPGVSYLRGDYDGESNSFHRYKFKLQASYRLGAVLLQPELSYQHTSYDEADPLFARSRDEDAYGIDLTMHYRAPFGWQGWALQGFAGYGRGDNAVTFYDTESLHVGSLLIYSF